MKQLILYDFLRHIKRNLVTAFVMALICLLTASLYSLLSYEYGRYRPFAKLDTNNGFWLGDVKQVVSPYASQDEALEKLSKYEWFDRLYQGYISSVTLDYRSYLAYVYEEWVWENWQGRLQSGSWFDAYEEGSEVIPVILCGSSVGHQPGDIVTAQLADGECKLLIQGILQNGTEVIYKDNYSWAEEDYDHMYMVPDEDQKFLIMQKEAADDHGIHTMAAGEWGFVGYDRTLTEEETTKLNQELTVMVRGGGTPHKVFLSVSGSLLLDKLFVYIPIMAVGLVLTLVALFAIAFVNVEKGARYYSIYYLVGARKRSCFLVACGNILGSVAVSAVFYALGRRLLIWYTRKENILYSTMPGANVLAAALYLLFALFLAVCMYFAMRKVSPLKLLKKHN